ncbi:menaquinone biosynthetic enzyme MqnA/MqnD family protein [Anaeroselena agilis]|uniref:Chorismate dehydratase n=1 Tax=Anaeroselena agilis TaxID=3063788 RepID=A0ABU3NTK9_9FIRM|nr:menaquinone biosynthesis protein [Selenomonadales bacterium 4137-cl]
MDKPRLGHINFINCLPLDWGLTEGGLGAGLEIRPAVPATLNSLMVSGELDVSPVSSIVYAQNPDKLLILPNLSISAPGALQSIVVVAKRPLADLGGRPVALTAKSATSHGLLKIILGKAYGVEPEYSVSSLSLADGVLDGADAALFIGDDALFAYHNRRSGLLYYDLGDEWRKLTGGAMVYALWVADRGFAARRPDLLQLAYDKVRDGFRYGLTHLEAAAAARAGATPLTAEQVVRYIGLLDYRLDEARRQALTNYYRLAADRGLIPAVPTLAFAAVKP